ncbi:MAG TPA: cardiolipin synthase [Bacillota bacterium]|nr:cardiolipin synthase [Bacillota bacterium]
MKPVHKAKTFKITIFAIAIAIQVLLIIGFILLFNQYFAAFYGFSIFLSVATVIWILNKRENPAYKIAWIIPIMIFPIFGGLFYLFLNGNRTGNKTKEKMNAIRQQTLECLETNEEVSERLEREDPDAAKQSRYIQRYAGYPLFLNEEAEYLSSGEEKFERLMEELEKAERYIFLEYFIIQEGLMWNSILEILKAKAAKGIDVRVLYDGAGCMETLPFNFIKKLGEYGIKACVFNPMIPVLSIRLNNRDHRKIAVIDGVVGFVGGINLADEYINEVNRHGHWKDAAIMLKGKAVWNLMVMFLSMWNYVSGANDNPCAYRGEEQCLYCGNSVPEQEKPGGDLHLFAEGPGDGYIQPFADSPLDDEPVSETVYLNLIYNAQKYIYITTPYLILDNEMVTALCTASKSGVDVRIITPYHGDKRFVHASTRSYYPILVESGIKIYEYTPGFIHSKTIAIDDEYGVVGTINMDYRSLYLHFECGIWMYRSKCICDIRRDFEEIIPICKAMTEEELKKTGWIVTLIRSVLRVFAPLL